MNKEAKNMEAIYKAKQHHDTTCPYGGTGTRICMCGFDVERMGWEEGDVIAGLVVTIDSSITSGRFRVECDAEPTNDETIEIEDKDLVSV
jgi:hypothetical protein